MTNQILIVFGVLVGAIALFGWGRIRVDIVAILVVLALMLSHVLTPDEALAGNACYGRACCGYLWSIDI